MDAVADPTASPQRFSTAARVSARPSAPMARSSRSRRSPAVPCARSAASEPARGRTESRPRPHLRTDRPRTQFRASVRNRGGKILGRATSQLDRVGGPRLAQRGNPTTLMAVSRTNQHRLRCKKRQRSGSDVAASALAQYAAYARDPRPAEVRRGRKPQRPAAALQCVGGWHDQCRRSIESGP